jgi:hypothetical protein
MRGAAWQRPIAAVLNSRTMRPEGTAFLVMPDLALTCAHVVEDATRGAAADKVTLRFHFLGETGIDAEAKIVADRARTGADIAVLRLTEPVRLAACQPFHLRAPDLANGPLPFRSWGYPKGYDTGDEAHARITVPTPTGLRAVHEPDHPRFLEKGFSGAPAASLTQEDAALAVGMAVTVDRQGQPIGELVRFEALLAALRPHARPYRPLRPFEAVDRPFFFGRSDLGNRQMQRLEASPLLVLTGEPGSGKSSLLRAGLMAAHAGLGWRTELAAGADPVGGLRTALGLAADTSLRDAVRAAAASAQHKGLLLCFDQAEEFTTSAATSSPDPALQTLADDLARLLATTNRRLRVIFGIRDDYLHGLFKLGALSDMMEGALRIIRPLDQEELVEAIVEPARMLGVAFDDGVPEQIARDALLERFSLTSVQIVLDRMWSAGSGMMLTEADYKQAGITRPRRLTDGPTIDQPAAPAAGQPQETPAAAALAALAAEALAELRPQQREDLKAALLELVEVESGAARRAHRPETDLTEAERAALQPFLAAHLVVRTDDAGVPSVTLAHDSLITAWPDLRQWLEETREYRQWIVEARRRAGIWRKTPDQLLTGSALSLAQTMREQFGALLSREEDVLQLVDASERARFDDETRRLREAMERAATESRLREEAEARAREAQLQESRAIATLARQASERGDHMTAILAALEVLPDPAAIPPRARSAVPPLRYFSNHGSTIARRPPCWATPPR